jgi:hypothetical protein
MAVVPENTQSSFWSDLIDNAVPALTAAGLTMSSNASNNKASDALMRTTADAANVINSGYDEQLAALQKGYDYLRGLSGQQLEDVTASGKQNVGDYADQMYGNVDAYAGELLPYFQNYGQSITGNTGNYISNLGDVQNSAEGTLQGAYDTAAAEIAPYAQSGQQANEYLSTILGSDPSQMTASQRVAYDNAKRDALAALAASSLRGSGKSRCLLCVKSIGRPASSYGGNKPRKNGFSRQHAEFIGAERGELAGQQQNKPWNQSLKHPNHLREQGG